MQILTPCTNASIYTHKFRYFLMLASSCDDLSVIHNLLFHTSVYTACLQTLIRDQQSLCEYELQGKPTYCSSKIQASMKHSAPHSTSHAAAIKMLYKCTYFISSVDTPRTQKGLLIKLIDQSCCGLLCFVVTVVTFLGKWVLGSTQLQLRSIKPDCMVCMLCRALHCSLHVSSTTESIFVLCEFVMLVRPQNDMAKEKQSRTNRCDYAVYH